MISSRLRTAPAAVIAWTWCALVGPPAAFAQDCERHMLTGPEFANDQPFNWGARPRVGITWDPDGSGPQAEVAVIAGEFATPGVNIVTWDGHQFTRLGSGLNGIVRALAVVDGQLVAGGEFSSRLAVWNGAQWQPFAGGANGTVYDLHFHNDELYAAGSFTTIGGRPIPFLARWDGAQWHAVGSAPAGGGSVRALETHEGDLYAGGDFVTIGGVAARRIAKWDGKAWSPLGADIDGGTGIVYAMHSTALAGAPQLLVGGFFNGAEHLNFARWDGSAWISSDTLFSGSGIFRFSEFNGRVVAAGAFTSLADLIEGSPPSIIRATAFAQWDGQHWAVLDPSITPQGLGQAMVEYNDELLLGGQYTAGAGTVAALGRWAGPDDVIRPVSDEVQHIEGSVEFQGKLVAAGAFQFADLHALTGIAEWDGARWRPFGSVVVPPFAEGVRVHLVTDGESLVVFGDFTQGVEGVPANSKVARWRHGAWETMGDLSTSAQAAAVVNAEFYAAFPATLPGPPAPAAAQLRRWNGSSWQELGELLPDSLFYSMTAFNGDLVAGGVLNLPGGPRNVLRWNTATQSWAPLDLPGGALGIPFGNVSAIATFGDQLIIGGSFPDAFDVDAQNLIIWNGAQWVPFNLSGAVRALAVGDEGVYIRGRFTAPDAPGIANLALWTGSELQRVTPDNPSFPLPFESAAATVAAFHGEALLFQPVTTAADGRTAHDWTRITRQGGVPAIAQQPQSGAFTVGDTLELSVTIPSGYEPLTFQWLKNDAPITDGPGGAGGSGVVAGATTPALTITTISTPDAGAYTLFVSNACGDVLSTPAAITVFCLTDFNHDGVANSTDVSDFINAWFDDQLAGTLLTDFNHDGAVNSTDVSDFINAWFNDQAAACG